MKTKPEASPSEKFKISKGKTDTMAYYDRLSKVNTIAKTLSPDGKLYGNFQIEAAKMFDNFKLKQEDKKEKNFKKETLSFLDKSINKKNKTKSMPRKIKKRENKYSNSVRIIED
jgi:uncharacterized protein (UPF0128 family)